MLPHKVVPKPGHTHQPPVLQRQGDIVTDHNLEKCPGPPWEGEKMARAPGKPPLTREGISRTGSVHQLVAQHVG